MTIPFCKDCVHLLPASELSMFPDHAIENARCGRVEKEPEYELTTGKRLNAPHPYCSIERAGWWASCGKKGRYFVAREFMK